MSWQIYHFDILTSTQDVAREYVHQNKAMPFAVQADRQTAARGRSGNKWVSGEGNLLASLVIPLENVSARHAGQYSFLTSIALIETLKDLGVSHVLQNKWPNDVLVEGRKIAGILLESDIDQDGMLRSIIIGIGLNLNAAPEDAVRLKDLVQNIPQSLECLDLFIKHLQKQIDILAHDGFAPIRQTWLSLAYGLGSDIRVRLPHETYFGQFIGLNEDGALIFQVAGEDNLRIIHSGEVFFGPA